MAETVQQMLERRKREREKKKTPAQEQAEGLAAPAKPAYGGSFKPKAATETKTTKAPDPMNPGYTRKLETEVSKTPTQDAAAKAKRLKTLDDDALSAKAEGGDFEAKAEAQRRAKQGNARFKSYEKYGE